MFVEAGTKAKGELQSAPTEWIEREVGELGAHIAAATCRWLGLIAELDRRGAHEAWGFHSCGAWLAWRCGVDPRSAREHVRVARALEGLSLVHEEFSCGRLSYSKVRAITRIATPEIESELRERELAHAVCQGGSAEPEPVRVNDADALMEVAERSLGNDGDVRPAGERHQVVVHTEAAALAGGAEEAGCGIEDGPAICAESARRLACDASLVSAGRKSRVVPAAMRRALDRRDEGRCRFPGCENDRWVDAHHIVHWARGGETKLGNLVLLCSRHHRLVHEGGFGLAQAADGELVFRRPDGRPIPALPSPMRGSAKALRDRNRDARLPIVPDSLLSLGRGERYDRELAVSGLLARAGPG